MAQAECPLPFSPLPCRGISDCGMAFRGSRSPQGDNSGGRGRKGRLHPPQGPARFTHSLLSAHWVPGSGQCAEFSVRSQTSGSASLCDLRPATLLSEPRVSNGKTVPIPPACSQGPWRQWMWKSCLTNREALCPREVGDRVVSLGQMAPLGQSKEGQGAQSQSRTREAERILLALAEGSGGSLG